MDTYDFTLQQPLEYDYNGQTTEAHIIELRPPSAKLLGLASFVKGKYMSSMIKMSQEFSNMENDTPLSEAESEQLDSDSDDIFEALAVCSDIDIELFVDKFKKLLTSKDICFLDAKEPLNDYLFGQLSMVDSAKLMGVYMNRFLLNMPKKQKRKLKKPTK